MIETNDFRNAVELINKSNNIIITTHTRPDGDACGSIVAMQDVLTSMGKKVLPLFLSEVPQWYDFLFDEPPCVLGKNFTADQLHHGTAAGTDLIIILDTNSHSQLPKLQEFLKRNQQPVLVIDHHITSDNLGDLELVDATASATGLIVLDLLKFAGWPINQRIAQALFVAVATDTGWFRFTNADARTYKSSAELIASGADPAQLYHILYENSSIQQFDLMVAMLNNLELHFNGRYAQQHITQHDFERTGAAYNDTENLIDQCRRIASVEAAALLVELKDGRIRCSLRGSGTVDVRQIAQKFGGGGHKMASGTYLPGPLENAKKIILAEMAQHFTDT